MSRVQFVVLYACVLLMCTKTGLSKTTDNEFGERTESTLSDTTDSYPSTLESSYPTYSTAETTSEVETSTVAGETSTTFDDLIDTSTADFAGNDFHADDENRELEKFIPKSVNLGDEVIVKDVENSVQSNEENPCSNCRADAEISGLSYTLNATHVIITWDPIVEENENCRYIFTRKMESASFLNYTRTGGHESRDEISTQNLCGEHTLKISADNYCYNHIESDITFVVPPNPFDIGVSALHTTSAEISVKPPKCNLSKVKVTCDSSVTVEENDNLSDNVGLKLEGLEPFTNYSCKGEIFKGSDILVGVKQFRLETKQAAPGGVENLTITEVTDASFVVMWEEPTYIPGILTEYEITVHGEPSFDAPMFCSQYTTNYNTITTIDVGTIQADHTFARKLDDLPGNYEFTVAVRAKTVDYGPNVTKTATTITPAPEAIGEISYDIEMFTPNMPKANLRWQFPCNTHTSPDQVVFNIRVFANSMLKQGINLTSSKEDLLYNSTMDVELEPSTNYTIMVYTINKQTNQTSSASSVEFQSPEAITSVPENLSIVTNAQEVEIFWEKPATVYGEFQYYQVNITSLGAQHKLNCIREGLENRIVNQTNDTSFIFSNLVPHYKYLIEISAVTSKMVGDVVREEVTTKATEKPPSVDDLKCKTYLDDDYSPVLNIEYSSPCDTYGVFDHYLIHLTNEQGKVITQSVTASDYTFNSKHDLKHEANYKVDVLIVNNGNAASEGKNCHVTTPAGIPEAPRLSEETVIVNVYDKEVEVSLKNDYFQDDRGEVKYFALLVGRADKWNVEMTNEDTWKGDDWPTYQFWNEEGETYQATPPRWEPLKGGIKSVIFKLGAENCTDKVGQFCNGPLAPNTEYFLAIRGYTSGGYQTSNRLNFITKDVEKTKNVVLIVGVSVGALVIMILIGVGCVYWRHRPSKPKSLEEANQIVHPTEAIEAFVLPTSVKIDQFPAYYNERKVHLADEFDALAKIGTDLERNVGGLAVNRKKNRYINILPYDCTRVSLKDCKDDYINASYIKGYSGEVEYIATQGPLEHTAADFWKMILNENCTVIAMVAQFEEQKKQKCHRYFPECREQMEFYLDDGGELQVRCSYALNFDYYIERQIVVQADDRQLTVTHLQFLNWPDFGCPDGTSNMLQFTKRLRRHMEKNDTKAVIHCSAGVGRTGTIVAVDILLQNIRDGKDVNIYGTVAALRQQRIKMVQAESQYCYIYQCILDEILQPLELTEIKPIDPIYENMENLIEMKVLSKQNNNCDTQVEYLNEINQQSGGKDERQEKHDDSDKSKNDEENIINNKINEEIQ